MVMDHRAPLAHDRSEYHMSMLLPLVLRTDGGMSGVMLITIRNTAPMIFDISLIGLYLITFSSLICSVDRSSVTPLAW